MNWIAVAIGGALGASARYAIAISFSSYGGKFPYATFIANAVGCFIMGLAFVLIAERALLSETWRYLLMIGCLGALTTYSAFSIEAIALIEKGDIKIALYYTLATLITCLLSTFIGLSLARSIVS